jgi:ribosomal protein S6--L-glutamate ligase
MPPVLLLLSRNPDAHGVRRLFEAGKTLGVCQLLDPHAIRLGVEGGQLLAWTDAGGELDLTRLVVLPRLGSTSTEYSLAVLEHLESGGAKVVNSAAGVTRLRSKFNMLGYLAAAGLPVPDSVVMRVPVEIEPIAERLGGWPVVLKFIRGSQGLGVAIAQDETVAGSVLEAMNFAQYDVLLQRYHARAAHSDFRVLVLGGQARWGMRRVAADGKFRSNIHRGGRAEPIDLATEHAEFAQLAEQAAAVFGLGLAGVDLFASEGGPVLLEVNSSPGFEKPEELYGPVVADAIVEYAYSIASSSG